MKISVSDFDVAVNRAGQYARNGYRVTYTSASKIVLQRLPNPKFQGPEEIEIHVRSNAR